MAEDSAAVQNMDKISYGVAGVVGLACLAIPLFLGGSLGTSASALDATRTSLEETIEGQEKLTLGEGRASVVETLEDQWRVARSEKSIEWLAYRQPIVVHEKEPVEVVPAVHVSGRVARIEIVRDAEKKKSALRVVGEMGAENANVEIESVILVRSVDGGAQTPVSDFSATGDFEYIDQDVAAGKTYAYSFTTRARSTDEQLHPLPAGQVERVAEGLGPTPPIPYDVAVHISTATGTTARMRATYWDYEAGQVVQDARTKPYNEGDYIDPAKRYLVRLVVVGSPHVVHIKDELMIETYKISANDDRPVENWDPVEPAAAPAEPDDDTPFAETEPSGDGAADTGASAEAESDGSESSEPSSGSSGGSRSRPGRFRR